MGLLDYDLELAKQAVKRFPGLLNEYAGSLNTKLRDSLGLDNARADYAMRNLDAMAGGDLKQAKAENNRQLTQKMVDLGLNFNPAAVGQVVWHGSPHKFSKFDMSKVGTGEGAQAYGYGLYMAESPAVANEYAEKLAINRALEFPGGVPSSEAEKRFADSLLSRAKTTQTGFREQQVSELYEKMLNPPKHMIGAPGTPDWAMPKQEEIKRTLENMEAAKRLGMPTIIDDSNLYKVDIPDEAVARFLDWDKPLSQQAQEVQAALNKYSIPDQKMTGQEINSYLMQVAAEKSGQTGTRPGFYKQFSGDASKLMKESGIPGIRYLDGGSRGAGQGSSNFVLFDDEMPRILEINGQATGNKPWANGEYGLLGK